MTFILFPFGREFFLNRALNPGSGESTDIIVALYQNDYTPAVGDDGSAIVESSFPGYTEVTIANGAWGDATIVANLAVADAPTPPVFTCTGGGGQDCYGVFIFETSGGLFLGAGRFDGAPLNMTSSAVITLDPFQGVLPLV